MEAAARAVYDPAAILQAVFEQHGIFFIGIFKYADFDICIKLKVDEDLTNGLGKYHGTGAW